MPCCESSRPKPDFLMPPKGSRGSLLTIPLMKTAPGLDAADQTVRARRVARPGRGAEAEARRVGEGDRLRRGSRRGRGSRPGRRSPPTAAGAVGRDVGEDGRRVEVAGAVEPLSAEQPARAPAATVLRTRSSTSSRIAGVASGPISVAGSIGSPTFSAAICSTKRRSNCAATSRCTMNRLAAMQDWPLLIVRALTAVAAAASRSALGMTMNGSLPPSSRTIFLISAPAARPTRDPGALAAGQRDGV